MFLATTAIDDFWDRKSKIVFLGEWCLLYGKSAAWKDLDYTVCDYPWDTMQVRQASDYCVALCESLLEYLTQFLNDLNGKNYSTRYWRTIIGSWLIRYVEALYDRYVCVEKAVQRYGQLRTWGLAETLPVPYDYKSFEKSYIDDLWNLRVFTEACEYLGITVELYKDIPAASKSGADAGNEPNGGSLKDYYYRLEDVFYKRVGNKAPVLFSHVYLPKTDSLKFVAPSNKMGFSCDFGLLEKKLGKAQLSANEETRASLVESLALHFKDDRFAKFLVTTLKHNFPLLYLEGYTWAMDVVSPYLKHMPSAVVTAIGLRASRALPFLAAEMSERGSKIITLQHGGSFGTVKISPMELHDQVVSDEYWTWGWEEGLSGQCRRLPSLLLNKYTNSDKGSDGEKSIDASAGVKVLYCGNSVPRYLYLIWSNPMGPQWKNYIEWQHRWVAGLSDKVVEHVLLRLSNIDDAYGWSQKERLLDKFPDIALDDYSFSLAHQLLKHDIIVIDSNHTVMLESLVANKPTILFWNPKHNELRAAAQEYYDELSAAGILHYSPEEAAEKVNSIFSDPYQWWLSEETQKARINFCNRFAYTEKESFKAWKKELSNLTQRVK